MARTGMAAGGSVLSLLPCTGHCTLCPDPEREGRERRTTGSEGVREASRGPVRLAHPSRRDLPMAHHGTRSLCQCLPLCQNTAFGTPACLSLLQLGGANAAAGHGHDVMFVGPRRHGLSRCWCSYAKLLFVLFLFPPLFFFLLRSII